VSERSERTISDGRERLAERDDHVGGGASRSGETPCVSIDPARCQGHGRCYELAPEVFGADDEGYGVVLGDGGVPASLGERARLAALNCPESAIDLVESEVTAQ
jgi:ferredoxin